MCRAMTSAPPPPLTELAADVPAQTHIGGGRAAAGRAARAAAAAHAGGAAPLDGGPRGRPVLAPRAGGALARPAAEVSAGLLCVCCPPFRLHGCTMSNARRRGLPSSQSALLPHPPTRRHPVTGAPALPPQALPRLVSELQDAGGPQGLLGSIQAQLRAPSPAAEAATPVAETRPPLPLQPIQQQQQQQASGPVQSQPAECAPEEPQREPGRQASKEHSKRDSRRSGRTRSRSRERSRRRSSRRSRSRSRSRSRGRGSGRSHRHRSSSRHRERGGSKRASASVPAAESAAPQLPQFPARAVAAAAQPAEPLSDFWVS